MKRRPALSIPVAHLATPGDWLAWAEEQYAARGLALGQIATDAHDEALYLILRTLDLPWESDARVLGQPLLSCDRERLAERFRRRIVEHTPAAYLTREAWLNGERFYVDERVLIPRSYFLELIPTQITTWMPGDRAPKRLADVCTGSGCLAILLAQAFPDAVVDGIDLSPGALEVATINRREHGLEQRLRLLHSDVFDAVPPVRYDIILSNPPYEPSRLCDRLPPEFQCEPRLALDGGGDGLAIIRKLLRQARERLEPHGVLLVEVGGLSAEMSREFAALEPRWLKTTDGSDCVCAITAEHLRSWEG